MIILLTMIYLFIGLFLHVHIKTVEEIDKFMRLYDIASDMIGWPVLVAIKILKL